MLEKYCCDGNRKIHEDYYINQAGGGMPIFAGSRNQAGHGFGSVMGGLFRSALPMLKRIGGQALRTGTQILGDMASGKKFSDVALQRVSEGLNSLATSRDGSMQEGSGKRGSRKRKRVTKNKTSRRSKKRHRDIFA
jgi:hypothetical protein